MDLSDISMANTLARKRGFSWPVSYNMFVTWLSLKMGFLSTAALVQSKSIIVKLGTSPRESLPGNLCQGTSAREPLSPLLSVGV